MSTAAASPNITHLPHTAHPIPLREQAFGLHCQGLRSPAIAAELGVPERTVRAWIATTLDDLKEDLQLNRRQQLLLAVERQHQLTATAWQQFEREAAARDALLDAALETLLNAAGTSSSSSDAAGASTGPSARPLHLHLPASTPAPRYLSLIIQANKETNRLLGLYSLARLHLLTPDSSDATEFLDSPDALAADPDIAAESATASVAPDIPAKTATDPSTLAAECVGASGGRPDHAECIDPEIPAESATDSDSPLPASIEALLAAPAWGEVVTHSVSVASCRTCSDAGSAPGNAALHP